MKCQSWIVDTSRAVASCCTTTVRKCCDCCPQLCGPPIKQAIKTNEIINTFLLGEKKNRPAMMSRFRRRLCFSCVAVDTVCVLSQTMHRLFCFFFSPPPLTNGGVTLLFPHSLLPVFLTVLQGRPPPSTACLPAPKWLFLHRSAEIQLLCFAFTSRSAFVDESELLRVNVRVQALARSYSFDSHICLCPVDDNYFSGSNAGNQLLLIQESNNKHTLHTVVGDPHGSQLGRKKGRPSETWPK